MKPKLAYLGRSLFSLRLHRLIRISAALMGAIPILVLLRIGVVLWTQPNLSPYHWLEISLLLPLGAASAMLGLLLLSRVVKDIQSLADVGDAAQKPPRQSETQGIPSAGASHAQDDKASLPAPPAPCPDDQNELARLNSGWLQIQQQLNRSLSTLRDHSLLVHNLEVGVEHSSQMVMVLDQQNQVVFSNRAARDKVGIMPDQNIRQALAEGLAHTADRDQYTTFMEEWKDQRCEATLATAKHGVVPALITVKIDNYIPDQPRKVIVIQDQTENVLLQKQLFRSEKLALLGQLISGVAHELSNPLSAILGFAELCQESHRLDPEISDNLDIIEREARRTSRIVDNLLNFTRKRSPERLFVDIHELLERCLGLLAYNFKAHHILVKREYDVTVPDIYIDKHQIQQVLMNLIINASQAMQDGMIEKPRLCIGTRLDHSEEFLVVSIMDNGPGVPEENHELIFEPFFTTKENEQGTGLGLPISRQIVEMHHGRLQLETPADGGVCFRVELPLAAGHSEAGEPNREPDTPAIRKKLTGRVLVVDDEPSILAMVGHALDKMGLQVQTTNTINEAIGWLKRFPCDLLLVDFHMPDGCGDEIWEYIQEHQPHLTGKVIFISGDSRIREKLASRLVGVDPPILHKPFSMQDLRETVRSHLEPQTTLPANCDKQTSLINS